MTDSQKFQKLNFEAFSKEKLTDNKLRSINGGSIGTCAQRRNGDECEDELRPSGMTVFCDYPEDDLMDINPAN